MDLTGQVFGRLTVVAMAARDAGGRARCRCLCRCGKEKSIDAYSLRSGASQSCGCLNAEKSAERCHRTKRTHGLSNSPTYHCWESMIQRCTDPNLKHYDKYGGAGIVVCERWKVFENFLADMGLLPSLHHSIDRFPDQNGNYEPGNCRWATPKQQARNRRDNRILHAFGDNQPLCVWAEQVGISVGVIRQRLRSGFSVEEALTRPVAKRRTRIT